MNGDEMLLAISYSPKKQCFTAWNTFGQFRLNFEK